MLLGSDFSADHTVIGFHVKILPVQEDRPRDSQFIACRDSDRISPPKSERRQRRVRALEL
jgi:hypothetical protein